MDEDSDDGIFDLKNLNKFEREVYETYKKELNELVELSRNRRPYNVTIVTVRIIKKFARRSALSF
ncbi:hypothetical protein Avbf_19160 [Armadillidium vulgare]|nr:hypothetical protein Avbf_19160 [Armadillidium vulgare]